MTDPIVSTVAVFHLATGVHSHNAPPHLAPPPDDPRLGTSPIPANYADDTHSWDTAARAWVRDPDKVRPIQWAWFKAKRDEAQVGGCDTPLGRVDTDAASQLKIAGSVQMAMLAQAAGEPFSVDWTMQDNSIVTHDAAAMMAMGMAVGEHVRACHEKAVACRAQLEAATTCEELDAVSWPA